MSKASQHPLYCVHGCASNYITDEYVKGAIVFHKVLTIFLLSAILVGSLGFGLQLPAASAANSLSAVMDDEDDATPDQNDDDNGEERDANRDRLEDKDGDGDIDADGGAAPIDCAFLNAPSLPVMQVNAASPIYYDSNFNAQINGMFVNAQQTFSVWAITGDWAEIVIACQTVWVPAGILTPVTR